MKLIPKRLSLVEYGSPVDLSHEISLAIGIERNDANRILTEAGGRAASSLKLNYNPIIADIKGARAIDFAGLIRLTSSLELEVAPKFLGLNEDGFWREDFFFLSTLSRYGRLLPSERLSASGGSPRDLITLIAQSYTSMYEMQKRRPLRSYRRVNETDFSIDGDLDPVNLVFPSSDGFEQDIIRFDRHNSWNANIVAAAKELLPRVSDPSSVGALVRLIEELSPQSVPAIRRKPIPARQRAWKPLHDLAVDVLGGLGLSYAQGNAYAPGYLVTTWRVWEDLITLAARLGFGRSAALSQNGFTLGTKAKLPTNIVSSLSVYPDCVIESDGSRPRFLLDAKYKGHVEQKQLRISESDIYEALAFSKATGCDMIVLAYPAQPVDKPQSVGACTVFERIEIDSLQIVGIQIEARLISQAGGLRAFATNLVSGLSNIVGQSS